MFQRYGGQQRTPLAGLSSCCIESEIRIVAIVKPAGELQKEIRLKPLQPTALSALGLSV